MKIKNCRENVLCDRVDETDINKTNDFFKFFFKFRSLKTTVTGNTDLCVVRVDETLFETVEYKQRNEKDE